MSSYVKKLEEYLNTPKWMIDNIMFEGITGSVAYGVSTDYSDMDIVGFCIPPKELVFPHLAGEIPGFGNQLKRFDVWQQHGITDKRVEDILNKLDLPKNISLFEVELEMKKRGI